MNARWVAALAIVVCILPAAACRDVLGDDQVPSPTPTIETNALMPTLTPTVEVDNSTPTLTPTVEVDDPTPTPTIEIDDATPTPALTIKVNEESLTAGCVPDEVPQLVVDFIDALNRGDMERLAEIFPDEEAPAGAPTFGRGLMAFAMVTEGRADFVTSKPDELMAYFTERIEQGERQTLHRLRVVGPDRMEDLAGFAFYITRQADDLPEQLFEGKGLIDCLTMEIMNWVMIPSSRDSPP